MTTSATPEPQFDVSRDVRIPSATLGYFEARLNGLVHQLLLELYGRLEHQYDFTKRTLARRIGRRPEQLTRWLSYPTNLTLETMSNILVGLGYELDSVVLASLSTGERVQFPQRRDYTSQADIESIAVKGTESEITGLQLTEPSQSIKSTESVTRLAMAALTSTSLGKAESDQMNVGNLVNKQTLAQSYLA